MPTPLPNTTEYFPGFAECQSVATTGVACTSRASMTDEVRFAIGGDRGTRIWGAVFHPLQDTIADGIIFIWYTPNGGVPVMIDEVRTSALTASATEPHFTYTWAPRYHPFTLAAGDKLSATTTQGEVWSCTPTAAGFAENIL